MITILTIIIGNFVAGMAIADFVYKVLPDYWEWAFKKHSALEADEMQDTWYENEHVIYFVIICLGYPIMLLLLFAKMKSVIKKLTK